MKIPQLFLPNISKEQKEFLNLLDLTAKVHGETRPKSGSSGEPVWDEEFFHLENCSHWRKLREFEQKSVLLTLGEKILQEAYYIESAGMAYAAKMNLTAKSKEERQFYCFVAEEEAKHLRMLDGLTAFNKSLENIPSFALLIGEIIQETTTPSQLLLIQILLEGWGLIYYKSLAKYARDENVSAVFKSILKDEIRHHSAGVILFSAYGKMRSQEVDQFLIYLERLSFMVKIGPYTSCEAILGRHENSSKEDLRTFLIESDAVDKTKEKLELIRQLITKSLPAEVMKTIQEQKILTSMELGEMTEVLYQSMPGIFPRG